jgi:diguanylate cyclase (GGDEF)-like protein/PAS domain S-box-containing protein
LANAYKRVDETTDLLEQLESNHLGGALSETETRLRYAQIALAFSATIVVFVVLLALRAVRGIGVALQASAEEARGQAAFSELLMNNMPCAVCIMDGQGNVKRWNNNFLGYTFEEILEVGAMAALQPESLEAVKHSLTQALEFGFSETDATMKTKDGRWIAAFLSHRRFDYEGEACILGVGIDISKQKQAEQFSRLQRVALESASEAIVITDETGSIEWANPAFTTLTGYELEEVLGVNPRILKSGMMNRDFYKLLWSTILRGEKWSGELWNLNKDGNVYCEEMHIAPVRAVNERISNFVAVKHDITQRKQLEAQAGRAKQDLEKLNKNLQDANERILRISQTDALTGLANRRTIDDRMREELARTARLGCGFSVILGDLDHFKSINDEFGHLIGDRVLMMVAKVLSAHARSYDLPARFGGEEFMVLLPESTLADAMTIAQRIRCEVAGVVVPGIERQITMSLGIASWGHGDTAGELIGRADAALYQAKRRGRNRVVAQTSDVTAVVPGLVIDGEAEYAMVRIA